MKKISTFFKAAGNYRYPENTFGFGGMSKDEAAALLKTSPEALRKFEDSYRTAVLTGEGKEETEGEFFAVSAKQAAEKLNKEGNSCPEEIIDRIVEELLARTVVYSYSGGEISEEVFTEPFFKQLTPEELNAIPIEDRPMLSGSCIRKDLAGDTYPDLLDMYNGYLHEKDPDRRKMFYDRFRQGLDILDLDPVVYAMIETNPNSMGYWFPALAEGMKAGEGKEPFFKLPDTKIIRVPLPLLQLTRLDYQSLTPSTVKILNKYCERAFGLDENKEYFIKTGTYSSKFDFRNAHVKGAKEVHELGEYLLFIHNRAVMMASPLARPTIYGVSTTTEWVVREFIPDKENLPTIYKGLPLRTEYRLFVDFDTKEVLGMSPYWKPDVMKERFSHGEDADSPHQLHDYLTYSAHEEELMRRYEKNKGRVKEEILSFIQLMPLAGQWSMDVMQDGEDFYIIDMALAETSALKECVPEGLLKHTEENWIPELSEDMDLYRNKGFRDTYTGCKLPLEETESDMER